MILNLLVDSKAATQQTLLRGRFEISNRKFFFEPVAKIEFNYLTYRYKIFNISIQDILGTSSSKKDI
jgi:hypothetical protein